MSDAQAPQPHRRRLGNELRRLREFTGQTQRQLGQVIGANQTAVDRIEKGGPEGRPPAWPRVEAWALACQAADPDMAELRLLTTAALDEHSTYRHLMSEGLAAVQEEVRGEEAVARTLLTFNPWGIPGLLQTPDYAHRALTLTDYQHKGGIEPTVEARMRRQEILHDQSHRFEFVVTETGLRFRPGSPRMLAAQLAQVAQLVTLPTITFSVIPAGVVAHAVPLAGFVIHEDLADGGDPWVAVELYHRRVPTDKPDEVDIYRAQYDILRRSAVHADEAVALVHEVERSLEA